MLYTLEQGPSEAKIVEQCYRERSPLPPKIRDAPSLWLGLELFYNAFFDLSTCRADGQISWLAIDEYCDRCGIEDEQRDDMHYHMRQLDAVYLVHKSKKREQATKPPPKRKK